MWTTLVRLVFFLTLSIALYSFLLRLSDWRKTLKLRKRSKFHYQVTKKIQIRIIYNYLLIIVILFLIGLLILRYRIG